MRICEQCGGPLKPHQCSPKWCSIHRKWSDTDRRKWKQISMLRIIDPFEHFSKIATLRTGARAIVCEKMEVDLGLRTGTIILKEGTHLMVAIASDTSMHARAAIGDAVISVRISADDYHRIDVA